MFAYFFRKHFNFNNLSAAIQTDGSGGTEFERLVQSYLHQRHYTSSRQAFFNLVFAMFNIGIVALPMVAKCLGIPLFVGLIIVLSIATAYTSVITVKIANEYEIRTLEDLAECAFGYKGFYFTCYFQLIFSICLICITLNTWSDIMIDIIWSDDVTVSELQLRVVMVLLGSLLVFPVSFTVRSIASLKWISFVVVSLFIIGMCSLFIVLGVDTNIDVFDLSEDQNKEVVLIKPYWWIFPVILTFVFSYIHKVFLVYGGIRQRSPKKWKTVVFRSHILITLTFIVFGIVGYLSVLMDTPPEKLYDELNYFTLFPNDLDHQKTADVFRGIIAFCLLMTVPMESLVVVNSTSRLYQRYFPTGSNRSCAGCIKFSCLCCWFSDEDEHMTDDDAPMKTRGRRTSGDSSLPSAGGAPDSLTPQQLDTSSHLPPLPSIDSGVVAPEDLTPDQDELGSPVHSALEPISSQPSQVSLPGRTQSQHLSAQSSRHFSADYQQHVLLEAAVGTHMQSSRDSRDRRSVGTEETITPLQSVAYDDASQTITEKLLTNVYTRPQSAALKNHPENDVIRWRDLASPARQQKAKLLGNRSLTAHESILSFFGLPSSQTNSRSLAVMSDAGQSQPRTISQAQSIRSVGAKSTSTGFIAASSSTGADLNTPLLENGNTEEDEARAYVSRMRFLSDASQSNHSANSSAHSRFRPPVNISHADSTYGFRDPRALRDPALVERYEDGDGDGAPDLSRALSMGFVMNRPVPCFGIERAVIVCLWLISISTSLLYYLIGMGFMMLVPLSSVVVLFIIPSHIYFKLELTSDYQSIPTLFSIVNNKLRMVLIMILGYSLALANIGISIYAFLVEGRVVVI